VRRTGVEALADLFERIGRWSYDHRAVVWLGTAATCATFAAWAATTRFDTSFEHFFDAGDATYHDYVRYRDEFGSDEVAYVLYEAPDRPHGAWDLDVVRRIDRLTRRLEAEVPFVSEVVSPTNVEFMEPIDDGIRVFDLLDDFPEDQAALLGVRDRLLAKPLYVDGVASADGRYGSIVLEMEASSIDPPDAIRLDPEGGDGLDNLYPQVTHAAIEEILADPDFEGITFHHTGDVPLNATYNEIVARESGWLLALTLALVVATLAVFFRRPVGVLGPIAVVLVSLVATVGFIGAVGWPLDMFFSMMPTLLVAIGVANAVHIVSEFGHRLRVSGDRRTALRETLRLVGPPCFLTSVTTAIGFGAMVVSPIVTLSRLAVYAAFGVMATFLFSLTVLVVMLTTGRRRRGAPSGDAPPVAPRPMERGLRAVAELTIRRRRAILAVAGLVTVAALIGATRLVADSNFLTDLSTSVPVRGATERVDDVMGGTMSYVYVFDTGSPDGVHEPAVLAEIERLQAEADRHTSVVRKTYSIVDLLKDINQTFHDGDPAWHVLPDSRALVAQYLIVYEMSGGEELFDYVSRDGSRAALALRCKWVNTAAIERVLAEIDAYLAAHPVGHATLARTGIAALWVQLMDYITTSQIRGFLTALLAITGVMCLLFRSVTTGLIAMVPNVVPVAVTLGAMGWVGIPLDYTTVLVAPVAIGIAVDDTMHLMTRLRLEFTRRGDYHEALRVALRDVGRPLVITSVVLVIGFLVNLFSDTIPQRYFGSLLATTIGLALACDFLLLPALVLTLEPLGPARGESGLAGAEGRDRRE
jgi:hypothetical protein